MPGIGPHGSGGKSILERPQPALGRDQPGFYDPDHKPMKLSGTIRDLTEQRLRERELYESEQNSGYLPIRFHSLYGLRM